MTEADPTTSVNRPPKNTPKWAAWVTSPEFLQSYEWRRLRYQVLREHGSKCRACGRKPDDGAVIHVDHIKPRKTHPELALSKKNLQPLCDLCNHGKGNWDATDWRSDQPKTEKALRRRGKWQRKVKTFEAVLATAPHCAICRQRATMVRWRVYGNGDIHLVWWCCEKQVSNGCIHKRWAERFHAGAKPTWKPPAYAPIWWKPAPCVM